MDFVFQGEQDREELAAPNAQDAGEGVGHAQGADRETMYEELHSAFEDDSDDEDADDIYDENSPTYDNKNDEDDDWLGTNDGEEDASTNDDKTPTNRPEDLILTSPRKRSHEDSEPEQDPEDLLKPETSPRTKKRLRIEREQGYPYDERPKSLFWGQEEDAWDKIGVIGLQFRTHYRDTLNKYTGGAPRRPKELYKQRMGDDMPAFPDLPRRPSPLGQDAHKDGKWKGLSALPFPKEEEEVEGEVQKEGEEEEEQYIPSPEEKFEVFRDDDHKDDDGESGALPPARPSSPAPEYDDDEDLADSQERDNDESESTSQNDGSDNAQEDVEVDNAPSTPTPSLKSFEKSWADEDEDDDLITFSSFTGVPSSSTSDSVPDEAAPKTNSAEDSDDGQQQDETLTQDAPNDNDTTAPSTTSPSSSNTVAPPRPARPSYLERNPSKMKFGREVGQFSEPRPRDNEIATLKLENYKLVLNLTEEQKRCEKRKDAAAREYRELETEHNALRYEWETLYRATYGLPEKYRDLQGELLANQQRYEYDAQELAAAREKEDTNRLAYITRLKQQAENMKNWAEGLDANAEPMRLANDSLTEKLSAAEKLTETLRTQLEDDNATIAGLQDRITGLEAQIREVATQGMRTAKLYREATTPRKAPSVPSSPSTSSSSSSSISYFPPTSPSTPAPLPPADETREAREARWYALGAANKTLREAQRKADKDQDAEFEADRELRARVYRSVTGEEFVAGGDEGRGTRELERILEGRGL